MGQVANYCPVISRNALVRNSTSLNTIWRTIRAHFGFQSTGAHFLDFNYIHLESDERPEDLYQRLVSFIEDNLLKDSLLDEIRSAKDAKVLRTAFQQSSRNPQANSRRQTPVLPPRSATVPVTKSCFLCKQAGRQHQHYLSKCSYLPVEDRQYISRSRQVLGSELEDTFPDCEVEAPDSSHNYRVKSTTNRVSVKQSPHLKAFFEHHPLLLTLDTGAEISMIKASVAKAVGATIHKTSQKALQADGVTQLAVVGEVHLTLARSNLSLHLFALVVDNLDVDILAGTPFMITNDISLRPAKQQITIRGQEFVTMVVLTVPAHLRIQVPFVVHRLWSSVPHLPLLLFGLDISSS